MEQVNKKWNNHEITTLKVLIVATLVRLFLAGGTELGNDEVYYWTYALYPDWSHFDHPPMVGVLIQLTTLNLLFDSELFIRLGGVIISAVNTWMLFRIGRELKDSTTGLYAAILYTTSFYTSVIAGIFIMPDTPLLFFWLVSFYLAIKVLPASPYVEGASSTMLLFGIFVGLAMVSKYHGAFLWIGAVLYVVFYNRIWLFSPVFYASGLLSVTFFAPVVYWNFQNNFAGISYQGGRVGLGTLRLDLYLSELLGEFLYNNPINVALILMALYSLVQKRLVVKTEYLRLILLTSAPLLIVFWIFALSKRILPHWTGPAYVGLLLLAAAYAAERFPLQLGSKPSPGLPKVFRYNWLLTSGLLMFAYLIINFAPFSLASPQPPKRMAEGDFTLDMSGWKQVRTVFESIRAADLASGNMAKSSPVLTYRWFPGSHLDFYVCHPLGIKLLVYSKLSDVHKYASINTLRGDIQIGEDAYYLEVSNYHRDVHKLYGAYFEEIEKPEVFPLFRGGAHLRNLSVYRLRNCKRVPHVSDFAP